MLDTGFHQASGLQGLAPASELRVLGVAAQDDAGLGLETLWQICAHLQGMGYPVMVLDGTALETDESPGLLHLLQQAPWNDGAELDLGAVTSSLAVIPAAKGLAQLKRRAQDSLLQWPPLLTLRGYFRAYGLLVIHAPAPLLGPLLAQTATTPLVVMASGSSGVLKAYQSVKQIAMDAGLPCTVASIRRGDRPSERRRVNLALEKLQETALQHLGSPVHTTAVNADNPQDVQRLALQLLENAGSMNGTSTNMESAPWAGLSAPIARSH